MLLIDIFLAWLLADFLSGVGHWWQDRVLRGTSRVGFVNKLHHDNLLHHNQPAAMLDGNWFENINTTLPLTLPAALILYIAGADRVLWLAVVFVGFANLVHRFAHQRHRRLIWPVRALQWTGLFIPFEHHHAHHYDSFGRVAKEYTDGRYCVMTDWLNPVLDGVGFWKKLERVCGVR